MHSLPLSINQLINKGIVVQGHFTEFNFIQPTSNPENTPEPDERQIQEERTLRDRLQTANNRTDLAAGQGQLRHARPHNPIINPTDIASLQEMVGQLAALTTRAELLLQDARELQQEAAPLRTSPQNRTTPRRKNTKRSTSVSRLANMQNLASKTERQILLEESQKKAAQKSKEDSARNKMPKTNAARVAAVREHASYKERYKLGGNLSTNNTPESRKRDR